MLLDGSVRLARFNVGLFTFVASGSKKSTSAWYSTQWDMNIESYIAVTFNSFSNSDITNFP